MDINNLHEKQLIALPQQEQALAWLIENGPLVDDPGLPMSVLRALVAQRRILRLRRGVYLVPDQDGRLPSLPRAINLLDPDGYVTGHGALSLHNLNDQDVVAWHSVGSVRQGDVGYGQLSAHFVVSPARRRAALTTEVDVAGDRVVVATPARAIVDEVELAPFGLDYAETARVLRLAVDTRAATEPDIVEEFRRSPSVAGARRLGLLLELATGRPNQDLLAVARSVDNVTKNRDGVVLDHAWRLYLPQPRDRILAASR